MNDTPCTCGRTHRCDVAHIRIGSGVLQELSSLTEGFGSIVLVADANTDRVCGQAVRELLDGRVENSLIYRPQGLLIPNEEAIDALMQCTSPRTDLIIGIGSGVIQDLCKYVSFQLRLPYAIVATAPSMDGYASTGAAMILGGMKVTVNCHVPWAIIGDVDVLKTAPMELIQAGYGDILGKFSCLNDWKLSHLLLGEYFCPQVHDKMYGLAQTTRPLGPALLRREEDAIRQLMEALVGAGVAMAMVGNSRPASGSEHHLSHFFEITGILHGEAYLAHGLDVAYSSICTQYIRQQLLALEAPVGTEKNAAQRDADLRKIYASAAPGVLELQQKTGRYQEDRLPIYQEKWDQVRALLAQTPGVEELKADLKSIGLEMADFRSLYGDAKIRQAMRYAKDLKDRFTVLWLYYDLMEP